jgi:dipeptidyl aminopeptidase/acylaminoacyl peptidase
MTIAERMRLALAVVLWAAWPAVAAAAKPPVEAFATLPAMSQPVLSPDGAYLAAIQSAGGEPVVAIYRVGVNAAPAVVAVEGWTVGRLRWGKPDRLVLHAYSNQKWGFGPGRSLLPFSRAFAVSPDGSGLVVLLNDTRFMQASLQIGNVIDVLPKEPDDIYMPLVAASPYSDGLDIYRVNLRTGKSNRVDKARDGTIQWITDGTGTILAQVVRDWDDRTDTLRAMGDEAHDIATLPIDVDWGATVFGLSRDAKSVVYRSLGEPTGLAALNLETGDSERIFTPPVGDLLGAITDENTGRIVGAAYAEHAIKSVYFDPDRQRLQAGLEKAFAGLAVRIVSMDAAGKRAVAEVEGPRRPPTYYFVERTTGEATEITSSYPQLEEADLGDVRPYPYAARDGTAIPAYLTLPPGAAASNLPMVVLPHGGPRSRDYLAFDWLAQFLANRGYAVLQPNFRGSGGYGDAFAAAGFGQWGLKMQDDITDGVRKAIADGIADPRRICIVGASYGGYAALAGAAFTRDLYACAASVAGISDLIEFLRVVNPLAYRDRVTDRYWDQVLGSQVDDGERLKATSPARHANAIRCPVLLLHPELDTTVPIAQSEFMATALAKVGQKPTFIRLAGDDHYLRLGRTRLEILKALETFLAAHIGT